MCDVYRVSSSVRVEQMEAELSHQLSALRAEIEANGFPHGAGTSESYRCGSLVTGYDSLKSSLQSFSVFVVNCLDCPVGGT